MLSFMLNIKVKKDCIGKALESLSKIDNAAQGHKGRIAFMWFRHLEDDARFTLFESWEDQESLDAHIAKIIDIWNDFAPCLDGEPVSTKLDKLVKKKEAPTIKHIGLFNLKESCDGKTKEENAAQILRNVQELRENIGTMKFIEAKRPLHDDKVEFSQCDLAVYVEFANLSDYETYFCHELHRKAANFAASVSKDVRGITYESK